MKSELLEEIEKRYYQATFVRELGMELIRAEPGLAESRLQVVGAHLQQDGFVHAGVVATLADHTGGAAAWTMVEPHQTVLTVEFKINLLRPARGPELRCVAKVLRPGRTITAAEAEVTNPDGSLAAKLTMTLAVVDISKLR